MNLYVKYIFSLIFSSLWCILSVYLGYPWIKELSNYFGWILSWIMVSGIALIPGMALSFVNFSLLIDKRPKLKLRPNLPPLSILIAAYNEEDCIYDTLKTIYDQKYTSPFEVIVINDGSKDRTSEYVRNFKKEYNLENITLLDNFENKGKALVLNEGLDIVKYDLVITIDADSTLHKDSILNIVTTMIESDEDYAAVAGTILCKNHDNSFMTKLQYWDYLIGISSVKRIQSMYQGTLVAQGAFSIYKTKVLKEVGGWPNKIGEDIVLTWKILDSNYKIGHSENAICFTNVPETYDAFYKQRKRWSRGLIEAFFSAPNLLLKKRKSTFFIWYNLFFPFIDFVYLFGFFPGVLLAIFFKFYLLAGLMTLLQLPMAILFNVSMLMTQKDCLKSQGVEIPKHIWTSSIFYILFYQLIMTPATLSGYYAEILQKKKTWDDA